MHVETVIIIVPAAARIIFLIMKSLEEIVSSTDFNFCAKNEMTHLDECQNILFAFKIHFSIAHKLKPGMDRLNLARSQTIVYRCIFPPYFCATD